MNQFRNDAALRARLRIFLSVTGYFVLNGLSVDLADTFFHAPIAGQFFGQGIGMPLLFLEVRRYRQFTMSASK